MNSFGFNLKSLRTENKLSQPELAKQLGVSNGMISLWENDICEPTSGNIIKICNLFNVSSDYLLGLKDD